MLLDKVFFVERELDMVDVDGDFRRGGGCTLNIP